MRRDLRDGSWANIAVVAVALLALLLGGATEPWALATVAGAMAVVMMFASPPRHRPGWPLVLVCGGLLLLAVAAFRPAEWGEMPGWRVYLERKLHLPMPATRTAQPWLTAEAIGYLFLCLTWLLYVLSLRWTEETRRRAAGWLVAGVAVLAATAVFCFATGTRIPFWGNQENRGWFPNRNQMANVLALSGVLNYALIFDRTSRERRRFWWALALVAICAGLVISFSRAGILMFFAGIALWHAAQWRAGQLSARTAVALAGACLLLSLFLLFGGETIERFQPGLQESARREFRVPVQRDAIRFSKKEPWLGIGLGNFASLFPRERDASVAGNKAIHPESDWLWGAVELGWCAPALACLGLVWWGRLVWARGAVGREPLRLAAAVGVVIFALHGLVDVSAHRLGSLAVAALLAGFALPPGPGAGRGVGAGFRLLAVLVAAISGWWFASLAGYGVPPTMATLAHVKAEMFAGVEEGNFSRVLGAADRALRIAPLDQRCYLHRGMAEAFLAQPDAAEADFKAALYLLPHWTPLVLDEGAIWMAVGEPKRCADVWRKALRRSRDPGAMLGQMLGLARNDAVVWASLRREAASSPALLLAFLESARPLEAATEIAMFLLREPELTSLTDGQRVKLFAIWSRVAPGSFSNALADRPAWQKLAWRPLAEAHAQQKEFQAAWELVQRYAPPLALPHTAGQPPMAELERDFYMHPRDVAKGTLLALAQWQSGRREEALGTVQKLKKLPRTLPYLSEIEARLYAQQERWEDAWQAWRAGNAEK